MATFPGNAGRQVQHMLPTRGSQGARQDPSGAQECLGCRLNPSLAGSGRQGSAQDAYQFTPWRACPPRTSQLSTSQGPLGIWAPGSPLVSFAFPTSRQPQNTPRGPPAQPAALTACFLRLPPTVASSNPTLC